MENLIKHIQTIIPVTQDLEKAICEQFQVEQIDKKTIIVKQDQYCQKLYFLNSGLVRTYLYDKGRDISSWFYLENQFFTSSYSFMLGEASFENIEALEDCEVYSITHQKYQQLMDDFPAFQKFGRLFAERQLAYLDYYYKGYSFLTAKEKYDLMIDYFPMIELRVKLGHIASFLGVSQETLSRIRGKR